MPCINFYLLKFILPPKLYFNLRSSPYGKFTVKAPAFRSFYGTIITQNNAKAIKYMLLAGMFLKPGARSLS